MRRQPDILERELRIAAAAARRLMTALDLAAAELTKLREAGTVRVMQPDGRVDEQKSDGDQRSLPFPTREVF